MIKTVLGATAMALAITFVAGFAHAGPIGNACMKSDRKAANSAVCGCIQKVADASLRNSDQRRIAGFMVDPQKAQDVKMSKSDSDDAFWERYKVFGEQAELFCAR